MLIECKKPDEVAVAMIVLAFVASSPVGAGYIQYDPDEVLPKDKLLEGIRETKQLYADYAGGRMMKTMIKYEDKGVVVEDGPPRLDYQSWASVYPTYQDLFTVANNEVNGAE
jgi:hypothetical protein